MTKLIKYFRAVTMLLVFVLLALLLFGFFAIPDEISTLDFSERTINVVYSLDPLESEISTQTSNDKKTIDVKVSLFKSIPVKNSRLKIQQRRYVVPSGEIFGLRLYTRGVLVVTTDRVETPDGMRFPAQEAGIVSGDIITEIDGETVTDHAQVANKITLSGGKTMKIVYLHDGKTRKTDFTPAYSSAQCKYIGGLWIRDSAAGIGTMTYYEKTSGAYGGLGHAVCDVDTADILPFAQGDVVEAEINGCRKSHSGEAGELCGSFSGAVFGELYANTDSGVYGVLNELPENNDEIPVAVKSEVSTGKAQIIATVDSNGPQYYDIEIERVDVNDSDNRNMIIRITDEKLIEKCGGIVQGMSGSPIIQNKMLVGAVTHVFINEPCRGYAIFAENMLNVCDKILAEETKYAS